MQNEQDPDPPRVIFGSGGFQVARLCRISPSLMSAIQGPVKISAELPPVEYLELINQICKSMSSLFGKHHGIYGKHTGDGMLYYFIKKPESNNISDAICCALEIREMVKKTSYD
jgi:class 3 adenylate cyclase